MNPLKSNLNSCREGDYIYTCSEGWVKVEDLYEKNLETNTNGIYTLDGKGHYTDLYPSAWTTNPFSPDDKPPKKFKEDREVGNITNSTDKMFIKTKKILAEWLDAAKRKGVYKCDENYYEAIKELKYHYDTRITSKLKT